MAKCLVALAAATTFGVVVPAGPADAAGEAIWPASGQVTGMYGTRCPAADSHYGIDIAAATGTDVVAAQGGTISTGWDAGGYGNYLVVTHNNGWSSLYGHLSSFVRTSGTVAQGDHIGEMGSTGGSTGPHLHFEMRRNNAAQNFNSATACGATITARTGINTTFSQLGSGGVAYEDVVNGGGSRITGPNSYLDVSSTGQIYAWNSGYFGGSPGGYSGRFVDARSTPSNGGYWLLTSAGQIYAYGNAGYYGGSPAGHSGMVALASSPNGGGYAMVSQTGQVYAYGNAQYRGGSPANYSGKFVDIEMTSDGGGYWLLTSAGQIYAYGNAQYLGGSPAGFSRAIVAMSRTADGGGYVIVSKTGQVYAYGNAQYKGGSPNIGGDEIADISYRTDGAHGYVMVAKGGAHFAYNTPWLGNPAGFNGFF